MKFGMRKYLKYFVLFSVLFFPLIYSFSATLELQRIGGLELSGRTYSEWWYSGTRPVLYGVAEENSTVQIKIDEETFTTNADSSGNWSYATEIGMGDYDIEISQGEENISFILHAGQTYTSVSSTSEATESTTSLDTGFNQFVALSFGIGIILLATYFYFSAESKRRPVFENRMIKED